MADPLARVGELPGAHHAILAMQSYQGFREARTAAACAEMTLRSARGQRPKLRLIVDNTRGASSD
jgi:hypothetical protein